MSLPLTARSLTAVASYIVLLKSFGCIGFRADPQNEPHSHVQNISSWRDRQQALQIELKENKLSSPKVQDKVIRFFEQETADPNWAELAEGQDYEAYYGTLSELCQKIAETYGSPAAWRSLVYSTYNIDSPFGQWLISQSQTLPLYLEMLRSGRNGRSGFAKEAVAGMLARCSTPNSPYCSSVIAKRDEMMRAMRSELFADFRTSSTTGQNQTGTSSELNSQQLTSAKVSSSIEALGVCGTKQDLLLLEKLGEKYASENIDSKDAYGLSHRQAALWLIRNSESKIKGRVSAQQ